MALKMKSAGQKLLYLKKNSVQQQCKLNPKPSLRFTLKCFSKPRPQERLAWPQDQCSRRQTFPHCEDEFYLSKTLYSDSLIAKEPQD